MSVFPSKYMKLVFHLDCGAHLSVQMKPIGPSIDAGAQVQQVLNIECKTVFFEPPLLNIMFR